ncbi:MAG: flippase-like domain-containing protein [Lentisphaerae bacterium]|nr:flippase-like domain-containing protein [Lentisphaerota bacterium]
MKKRGKTFFALLRLVLGLGIIAFLVYNINKSSLLVEFDVESASATRGAVYQPHSMTGTLFTVRETVHGASSLQAQPASSPSGDIPSSGTLVRVEGTGSPEIMWTARTVRPAGLVLLGESFAVAGRNWPWLVLATLAFAVCLNSVVVRWKWILAAGGLDLSWGRVWTLMFIGHFFNAFLFGATGGDVVKAYYAARETGHRRTEAVATVFIDRVTGLFALLILASITMGLRFRFFMAHAWTRYALVFIGAVTVGVILGLVALLQAKRLLPIITRIAMFRRLSESTFGQVFARTYNMFYLCLTHPALLAKTVAISFSNHLLLVLVICAIGRAMLLDITFMDYLSLGLVVNVIAAIPVTPGGLGVRESAAVIYFGLVGVSATRALPVSLLVYAISIFWSLVGGIVFLLHTGRTGHSLSEEMAEVSDDA